MGLGPRFRSIAQVGLSVSVVVLVFAVALPRMADYGAVWDRIATMPGRTVGYLALLATWNLVTYWLLQMAALPGLSLVRAAVSTQTSTAVSNTLPAGSAIGTTVTWAMYRRWGFSRESVARAMGVTFVWNVLAKLATPAAGLVVMLVEGRTSSGISRLAVVSGVLLGAVIAAGAVVARRPGLVRRPAATAARLARHGPSASAWAGRAEGFAARSGALIAERWPALSLTAAVSHASLFAVLLGALRACGVRGGEVSVGEALTTFAIVRLALLVPITPGGAGLAEAGLSGLLIAAGGAAPDVVAGVLVFRALTWLVPIPLGAIAYLWWTRMDHSAQPVRVI